MRIDYKIIKKFTLVQKQVQLIASYVFLTRIGKNMDEIRDFIIREFDYSFSNVLDEICLDCSLDVKCQGSVPQAVTAFLE